MGRPASLTGAPPVGRSSGVVASAVRRRPPQKAVRNTLITDVAILPLSAAAISHLLRSWRHSRWGRRRRLGDVTPRPALTPRWRWCRTRPGRQRRRRRGAAARGVKIATSVSWWSSLGSRSRQPWA